ncbi:protein DETOXIFICATION 53 [Euphorbia lathyris]|uniref:protein DETOXIFICATION 53 n=1 Tax=Euphorbia lathyris TaxID=212925 RepID=UPI003313EAC8
MSRVGETRLLHGFLCPFQANGRMPLHQVAEEVIAIGKIACPIILTTILIFSRNVISMLFLSRLGKIELAGGSLALGFANITGLSVMKGLSMGMDPICGQAFGAKRWSLINQTYFKTLCLLLFVSLPISFLWLNVEPIFLLLGQDPDITNVAKVYMVFCIPELLAQALLHPMRSFLRTQGLTAPLTLCAVAAVILHTPINYLFATHFNLGVKGVALAIAFNTINMNIGLLIYVAASKSTLKPWHGITTPSMLQGWGNLLSLAVPSVISVCLEWWWYEIMLFLCGLLPNPKASVAATGILIQAAGLIYSFPFSLSCSLSTRVGHALGAGQPARAQWTAVIGIILGFTCGLTAAVLATAFRSVWGRLYTDEPEILKLISIGLPLLGLCEIGNSPQTAACGVLTGTARPKDGARINLYAFYLVGLPVAIVLTFKLKLGFQGFWLGLLAAQLTCVCMMLYTVFRTDWKHQAKRADELTSSVSDQQTGDMENSLLLTNQ